MGRAGTRIAAIEFITRGHIATGGTIAATNLQSGAERLFDEATLLSLVLR
jgi:hypothetical protein